MTTHPDDDTLASSLARGAAAGVAGTAAMTAFQLLVEMPLTGRGESEAPGNLVGRLLGRRPEGRRRRRQLNYAAHFAIGVAWGTIHGAVGRAGLRGQAAVGVVFAGIYVPDLVLNTALGLYEPKRWSSRDWAIDVVDKVVLAQATGLAFEYLARRS